jgi:hypothetical protein
MTIVNSKEFLSNEEKYFGLALSEDVCIERGDYRFRLIYRPVEKVEPIFINSESRQGWAKAAKEFVELGNEESFFPDFFEDED